MSICEQVVREASLSRTDSLGWIYHDVQKGSVCVDSRIVGFDIELERFFELELAWFLHHFAFLTFHHNHNHAHCKST